MRYRALARCALVLGLVIGASAPVHAQDASEARPGTRAIEKGREGVALYEKGKWAEALECFEEAERLYHSPVFLLYSARSLEKLGRLLGARELLVKLSSEVFDEAAPELWKQTQTDARSELEKLEARIPTITIHVRNGSHNALLTVDDQRVTENQPVALNPGPHVIVLSDGARRDSKRFTLREGTSEHVTLLLPASSPASVTVVQTQPATHRDTARSSASSRGPYLPGLIPLATGGTALLAGGVCGVIALVKSSNAREDLPASCSESICPESKRNEIEASKQGALDFASAADVLLISGTLLTAAGVVLLITEPGRSPAVTAHASPGGASLRLKF